LGQQPDNEINYGCSMSERSERGCEISERGCVTAERGYEISERGCGEKSEKPSFQITFPYP